MAFDTRTLAQIRSECRNRGEVDSDFVTDTELDRAINVAYRDYYSYLVGLNSDYFLSSETLSVVSGTEVYSLASDSWKVVGVDVLEGSDWYNLGPYNFGERNKYQTGASKRDTRYRLLNGSLYLSPSPTWSGSVKVWYIPSPAALALDGDTATFPIPGSEDFVVLHVLIQYAGKAEEDASLFASQMNALKQNMASAQTIDHGEPDTVRDTWAENGYVISRRGAYPRLPRP